MTNNNNNNSSPPSKPALMNSIWFAMIVLAVVTAAFTGQMGQVTKVSFKTAKDAVTLAIGLIGIMALWLGLVRIAEVGGLMQTIARAIRPIMTKLFPDVPPEDPAMSAMILNIAANCLGLGNAATPLGIKAMIALDRLNPFPGRATDAMCLFLAINTSNVTLLPLGVIAIRAAAGAQKPAAILIPTLFATSCSTLVAIVASKLFAKWENKKNKNNYPTTIKNHIKNNASQNSKKEDIELPKTVYDLAPPTNFMKWGSIIALIALVIGFFYHIFTTKAPLPTLAQSMLSHWIIPILMLGFVVYGALKGVPVYEAGIEGAKEGFEVAVKLIPFLVLILVAVSMFRASGAFELTSKILYPITHLLKIPPEVLPVALLRPLSGSGAFALVTEITYRHPNSFAAFLAGTIQGSTETTFYVLAVYFGAIGIKDVRYAVSAALLADLAGFLASVAICHLLYTPV